MLLGQVWSASHQGVEGVPVRVEARVAPGIPAFYVVGLPRGAVREGRDRILSALRSVDGASIPRKIIVNLAPADLAKDGSALDLAMAAALLAGGELVPDDRLASTAFVGELGLDGRVHPVRGVLSLVLGCARAGLARIIVPAANLPETRPLTGDIKIMGADTLSGVVDYLRGEGTLRGPSDASTSDEFGNAGKELRGEPPPDLAWIHGQALARRALEIAAAGEHPLLLAGPPGAGKTLLARALPGLLPDLDREASIDVTAIHSVAGLLPDGVGVLTRPPFRAPHHGASQAALVGGGSPLRPGEITLAHRGVLFLDELGLWLGSALDALREPLESGVVDLIRVGYRARFPARFLLVGAMNPCPCGRLGLDGGSCTCDPGIVRRYQARISGPLLDRIDLRVRVSPPPVAGLLGNRRSEGTAAVRARVEAARARGAASRTDDHHLSDALPPWATGRVSPGAIRLLESGAERCDLSARGLMRTLRVARTIALLDASDTIGETHVAEALQFRGV